MSSNEPSSAIGGRSAERRATRGYAGASKPSDPSALAFGALIVAVVVVVLTWATLYQVWKAFDAALPVNWGVDAFLIVIAAAVLLLFAPARQGWRESQNAKSLIEKDDLIHARIASAASRDKAHHTFGYAFVIVILLVLTNFVLANQLAVGRTFFDLPLMVDTFGLILKAFWVNVYIFVIAEVLVLVWGLIVAVARMLPGDAARPIRALATAYADAFRGMPAIITIYLVGFGIPLTGIPVLKDLSPQFYAILALTLTYGAYVAEVYRSGIESIHWSQIAGARSLGLSYFQTLRYVVVPQAVKRIIPPLLNDFIGLQKDTALVNVVGALDSFNQAKIIASNNFNLSPVTTVAVLFVFITIPQARFVDKLIERDQRRTRAR